MVGDESRQEVRTWGAGHAVAGGESRQEVRASSLDMHDAGITGEAR